MGLLELDALKKIEHRRTCNAAGTLKKHAEVNEVSVLCEMQDLTVRT
jgi:hypothetical protein